MPVGRSARAERRYLAGLMRTEGRTWAAIAVDFRIRYGVNARVAMRWARDWSQDEVARRWNDIWPADSKTEDNISTWERWPISGHAPSLHVLCRLAEIYACNASDLISDWGLFADRDAANRPPGREIIRVSEVPPVPAPDNHVGTDRRQFTQAAFLALIGFSDPLRSAIAEAERPRVVGREHVRLVESALARIEQQDAALGGNGLLEGVSALRQEVAQWLRGQSYTLHGVGDDLQGLLGELAVWEGWLAKDADQPTRAKKNLHDALLQARLMDDPALEVRALSYLCLVLRDMRPRESLQCAQAAERLAQGWATSRLSALLHLRSARAFATLNEPTSFGREMTKARSQLDRGPHEDDPLYVRFVTPGEVFGITGLSFLAMGRPERAATEFRRITESPDPAYRRNLGYYTVQLAEATRRQKDITGASTIALGALPLVAKLESGRTTRALRTLRTDLGRYRISVPAAREFTDAYDEVITDGQAPS